MSDTRCEMSDGTRAGEGPCAFPKCTNDF